MPKLRAEDRKSQPGKKRKEVWLVDFWGAGAQKVKGVSGENGGHQSASRQTGLENLSFKLRAVGAADRPEAQDAQLESALGNCHSGCGVENG